MPLYTFRCEHCQTQKDEQRLVEDRRHPVPCAHCSGMMERVPEMCVIDTFEPYYDEGLGCDVHSRSDRKAEMARLGLVEAGDPVHGGRNYDASNPVQMKKLPLQGVERQSAAPRDSVIKTHDETGKVVTTQKSSETPTEK